MKNILRALLLLLFVIPGIFAQQYSSFEYVYATAGSPSIRVVTVEFKDGTGVKLKFEHDLDLSGNRLDRTLTLTSGYVKGRNQSTTFTAHRGYYTSTGGRAAPGIASVLDELVEIMPATGAGNDLDNDRALQRRVVGAVLRLNQLVFGSQVGTNQPAHTPNATLIGYIRREHVSDGCGCTFHLKTERNWTVNSNVFSEADQGDAWMNIDGQDVRLKLSKSPSSRQRTKTYVGAGVRVRLTTLTGRSYGEGHDYTGTITVVKGDRTQTIQIVGSCGC